MRHLTRAKKPSGKAAKAAPAASQKPARAARRSGGLRLSGVRRWFMPTLGAMCVATFVGSIGYAWHMGMPARLMDTARDGVMTASAGLGLFVREVYVVGREETDRQDLVDALGISVGDPIFGFDPEEARERIEGLGWVRQAAVRRALPDTVIIRVEEREAVAIWQHEGEFVLIDADGVVIGEKDVHRHAHLNVVVGPDASRHAMDLLTMLAGEPELEDRVVAAVRIGQRRWNLRMENGIEVVLPEVGAEEAWQRLASYQRDHEILSRAVGTIDLRYPDRMTVELTEPGLQEVQDRLLGEET